MAKQFNDTKPNEPKRISMEIPDNIIIRDGLLMPLAEWQQKHGQKPGNLSEHFAISEWKIGEWRPFKYSELLINLMEMFRLKVGVPVTINSGFRTREKQLQLIAAGYRAASYSPHEQGMAFDINTTSWKQTCEWVSTMFDVAKDLGLQIRIGHKQYWNDLQPLIKAGKATEKQCFFHVDVCPMYFGKGMPYYADKHPKQWETQMNW